MRALLFIASLALFLPHCTSSVDVSLTLPAGEHESALIILRLDRGPQVIAARLPLDSALRFTDLESERSFVPVDVLLYHTELATLGFAPGEVPLLSADDGGRPPPEADRVLRSTREDEPLLDDSFGSVRPLPNLGRTANPCSRLSASQTNVARHPWRPAIVRGTDSSALFMVADGRFFLVDQEGHVPMTLTSTIIPKSAMLGEDGRHWVGGEDGQVSSGLLVGTELQDVVYHGPQWGLPIRQIAGGLVDGEMELFFVDFFGNWIRQHGDVREMVYSEGRNDDGGTVWLGPGHALLAHDLTTNLIEYEDGDVRPVTLPQNVEAVTGLSDIPGVGVVTLGAEGSVYKRQEDGRFAKVGNSGIALLNFIAAPFADRVLIGAASGVVVEWVPAFGFCEPTVLANNGVRSIVDIGSGQAIIGSDPPDFADDVVYTRIERR